MQETTTNKKYMAELLNTEDLVKLHAQLEDFAHYHRTKGGLQVAQVIKDWKKEKQREMGNGSPEGLLRSAGYDKAVSDIFALLEGYIVK